MRKMFSKNQIKEIVNQGIESGEISSIYAYMFTGNVTDGNKDEYSMQGVLLCKNPNLYINEYHGFDDNVIILSMILVDDDDYTYALCSPHMCYEQDIILAVYNEDNGHAISRLVDTWNFETVAKISL